jgi:hypothetical protein
MKTIKVEWKARPNTGVTEIDLIELGVETKAEFNSLSHIEQCRRINEWLMDNEENIFAKAESW